MNIVQIDIARENKGLILDFQKKNLIKNFAQVGGRRLPTQPLEGALSDGKGLMPHSDPKPNMGTLTWKSKIKKKMPKMFETGVKFLRIFGS